MAPAILKKHFTTNHSDTNFLFKGLLESQKKQNTSVLSNVNVSEKTLEASYLVAEIIAQKRKRHSVGENITLPACIIIVSKMLGQNAVHEIEKNCL